MRFGVCQLSEYLVDFVIVPKYNQDYKIITYYSFAMSIVSALTFDKLLMARSHRAHYAVDLAIWRIKIFVLVNKRQFYAV